jgi:polyhydroxyalkanoate synthesis repressor PhaR
VTSCYITLEDVKQLVLDKVDIQVLDAKTSEDITLTILLQIVLEEESLGKPMFTYEVLTQLIRFYGNAMQSIMGSYLEKNLNVFAQIQQRLLEQGQLMYGKDVVNKAPWDAFMASQAPMIQNLMNSYLEQSANLFVTMQNQWQDQAQHVLKSFNFSPFINPFMSTAAESKPADASTAASTKKDSRG